MADPPLDLLDRLYIFNEDARRTNINKYRASGLLDTSGFTLYKFHLVPAIKEEQRALHPSAVSVHYAEIRAGLRWSLLTDEQQQYWRRCTLALFDGCLWPVKDQTLDNFVAGALDAQPTDDDEDSDDDESDSDSYHTQHVHGADADSSRPTSSASHLKSDNGRLRTADDFEASPDIYDGVEVGARVAEHASEDVSVKAGLSCSGHGYHDPYISPDYDAFENFNQSGCVSERSNRACVDRLRPHNDVVASDGSLSLASRASAGNKQLTPQEITDLVRDLQEMDFGPERDAGLKTLNRSICPTGFTLFLHQALAFRPATRRTRMQKEGTDWNEVWLSMPTHLQTLWRDDTLPLKGGLSRGAVQSLNHFKVDEQSNRSRRYRNQVQVTFDTYHTKRMQADTKDATATRIQPALTTIVDILHGDNSLEAGDEELIAKILHSIKDRMKRGPQSVRRVRCVGARIDYGSSTSDVTSIRSRLRSALPGKGDGIQRRQRFEDLLRPLAYFNSDSVVFGDLPFKTEYRQEYDPYFTYSLCWASPALGKLKPFTAAKKHNVTGLLLAELRWRAYGEDLAEAMRLPSSADQWSILSDTKGFAARLLGCFAREDLTSAVYDDLLEQQMYHLFARRPDIAEKCDVRATKPHPAPGRVKRLRDCIGR